MKLRARSPLLEGRIVTAQIAAASSPLRLDIFDQDQRWIGNISAEAALADYDVIEASADERTALQRAGHFFGGTQ